MTVSQLVSFSGTFATLTAAVVVVLASHKTSAARVWREEAEAQKQRADRLSADLTEIKQRLARIEAENARLIRLLTALDPAQLTALRYAVGAQEDPA
ncbi:hypothetical protein AB0J38_41150 [Streptomyces sp. NPDC050095]|uniref:hypothetical protein n=1 Tax=unclassified Streptomyces TaxID=2593676 RepID=UPI0034497515